MIYKQKFKAVNGEVKEEEIDENKGNTKVADSL